MSKTLSKGLQLLFLFSEEDSSLSLKHISERANIPKSTVLRLLKTLDHYGLVQKSSRDHYELGTSLLELGELVAGKFEIRNVALPYMQELQSKLQESVQLVIMDNKKGVYIEKVESNKPVRLYENWKNSSFICWSLSEGTAFFSAGSPD